MLMTFVHMSIQIPWIRLPLLILLRIADTVLPLVKVDSLVSTRLGMNNVRWIPQQRSWLKIWQVAFISGGYSPGGIVFVLLFHFGRRYG